MNKTSKPGRRPGDRCDGRLVRGVDPFFKLIPYIMRTRTESQVYFAEKLDVTNIKKYLLEKRAGDIPDLSFQEVLMAAIVRTYSQRPCLNRFISNGRIYARNYFRLSLTMKKNLTIAGEETNATPYFNLDDTIYDVVKKVRKSIEDSLNEQDDGTIKLIASLPGFLIRFIVFTMRALDKIGLMPKFFYAISPFHSSIYMANIGSIGVNPPYHHLYEFGTVSVFLTMGMKEKVQVTDSDGVSSTREYLNVRFSIDERICDGFYFASSVKLLKRLLKNPALLEIPPEQIITDK